MGTHTLSGALNGALASALAYRPATGRRKARSGAPHRTGARVLRDVRGLVKEQFGIDHVTV